MKHHETASLPLLGNRRSIRLSYGTEDPLGEQVLAGSNTRARADR